MAEEPTIPDMQFQCRKFELSKEMKQKLLHTKIYPFSDYASRMYFLRYTKKSTVLPALIESSHICDAIDFFHSMSFANNSITLSIRERHLERFEDSISFPWPPLIAAPCSIVRQQWIRDTIQEEKDNITTLYCADQLVVYAQSMMRYLTEKNRNDPLAQILQMPADIQNYLLPPEVTSYPFVPYNIQNTTLFREITTHRTYWTPNVILPEPNIPYDSDEQWEEENMEEEHYLEQEYEDTSSYTMSNVDHFVLPLSRKCFDPRRFTMAKIISHFPVPSAISFEDVMVAAHPCQMALGQVYSFNDMKMRKAKHAFVATIYQGYLICQINKQFKYKTMVCHALSRHTIFLKTNKVPSTQFLADKRRSTTKGQLFYDSHLRPHPLMVYTHTNPVFQINQNTTDWNWHPNCKGSNATYPYKRVFKPTKLA